MQWQGPLQIKHGKQEKNNGEYGIKSPSSHGSYGGHRLDRFDMIEDGRLLDTLDRRGFGHMYYSSYSSDRHHDHHHYHPYRRNDRGYFPDEFKKVNPPTFNAEMKKSQDAEAWLLGMKKFFQLHDYSENMKERTTTFSLKGKVNIWWEDVKNVKGIHEEDLTWHEFERLFKKKYLSEIYFDDKARSFMSCRWVP